MATNIMGLMDYVQQQGALGRQQGQQNQFAKLASQAYGAPTQQRNALVQQAVGVDPMAGMALGDKLEQQGDARARKAAGAAKYVLSAVERGDPAAIQGAYKTVYPFLSEMVTEGGGAAPPEQWDPVMAEGMHQLLAAVEGGGVSAQGVQSTYVDDQGQRVAIMRDGSTRVLGGNDAGATQQTITINGPDGRPAQYTFDRRTGGYIPAGASMGAAEVQPSAPQAPAPQGDHFAALTGLAGEFPGVQMTSGMRTPERNSQVGGVPNSQHVRGTAADYAVPQQLKPAFMSRARQLGYQPIDEGDHIHLQLPRGGSAQSGQSPFVGRSPEEQAALTTAAQEQAKLAYLPQAERIKTKAELEKAMGLGEIKRSDEAATLDNTRGRDANKTLSLLAEAEELLPGATGSRSGAIADDVAAFVGRSTEGAQKTAALKTIAGQLTSSMPRMQGPQSDKDVQLYKEMAGDLANDSLPVATRQAALRQIRALNEKYAGQQSGQQAAVRRATNPQTGEVLELRNGQWVSAQ